MQDPLAPLSLTSSTKVPNVTPTDSHSDYRLAIIGTAPGADEETVGVPFVGQAGRLLDSILGSVGIQRSACFVGNVCKYRPPGDDITEFDTYIEKTIKRATKLVRLKGSYMQHEKVLEGQNELRHELSLFKPHCTLLLGQAALSFARGPGFPVDDWRGSIISTSIGKAVSSYDPSTLLAKGGAQYSLWPFLKWDCRRARMEAESPKLVLPQRSFDLDLSAADICQRLDTWPSGLLASVDIEGGLNGWTCMGIASAPNRAFIVAFGQHSPAEQGRIYASLSRFLYRIDIPKCLQNSLYDNFVLYYGFNMLIRNVREDTMLKWASLFSELPKGLDTQTSVLTREPAWKHLIAYSAREQLARAKAGVDPATEIRNKHRACCIDASVTLENSLAMDAMLEPRELRYYRFNMSLLPAFLRMERRGFRYNKELANEELINCRAALSECATRIEARVGYSLLGTGGSISQTKSKKCLYEEKGYPPQFNGRGPDKKVTTDVSALLKLAKKFPNDPLLADLLLHSCLDGVRKTLEIDTDPDGRVRCAYNVVGTETMRITCYESPTGSGANLQTITKKLRRLFQADPGYHLFQCDLAGADGWTVAAHCLKHGDSTMWDDYSYGLKPAKIIALAYSGVPVSSLTRDGLAALCKHESSSGGVCDQDSWLYFACKRVQHATNYGVKAPTGVAQIMLDSYKMSGTATHLDERTFEELQRFYFVRYPGLYQWHNACRAAVFDGRDLTSASGHTRKFHGRRKSWNARARSVEADHDTWKEYLADEPQENTTYATNLALHKLWNDPENRRSSSSDSIVNPLLQRGQRSNDLNSLVIEPLHQVHDALIGQFPITHTPWACAKLRTYFSNELAIANIRLTIPFEGAYGPSWGELGKDNGRKPDDPKYKFYGGGTI